MIFFFFSRGVIWRASSSRLCRSKTRRWYASLDSAKFPNVNSLLPPQQPKQAQTEMTNISKDKAMITTTLPSCLPWLLLFTSFSSTSKMRSRAKDASATLVGDDDNKSVAMVARRNGPWIFVLALLTLSLPTGKQ
jgi:hypothetical protein